MCLLSGWGWGFGRLIQGLRFLIFFLIFFCQCFCMFVCLSMSLSLSLFFPLPLCTSTHSLPSSPQGKYLVQVFKEVLDSHDLPQIKVVDFSWFPDSLATEPTVPKNGQFFPIDRNEIEALYTKRNPADKLEGKYKGMLTVAYYAWDGNSFPGNEYWAGMLCASGDPAAASCSTIPEIQNAYVNGRLGEEEAVCYYPKEK